MPTPAPTDRFERAKGLFLQGLADLAHGRLQDAEQRFQESLQWMPGRTSTLVNLAAVRVALGRPGAALEAADQVLAGEPTNADALLHRAQSLRQLARHADAAVAFEQVLAQRPELDEAWFRRALCLLECGRPVDALACLDRALALDATLAAAWSCRADLLRDMGRLDEARASYRQARAHGADAELMDYCLAALGERPAPQGAPRRYVEALFDAYAGQFQSHVLGALHYRAHDVLTRPLPGLHPAPFESALDLGCGTGLCGPLLRPLAGRLVGVDLSQGMLDLARATGAYDELVHADVLQHLAAETRPHGLVIAADVFIYVGALEPVFAQVARLVPAGGVFCFSAERGRIDDGLELLPSLRYAHGEAYVRRLARVHGFSVLRLSHETVREEQRVPVPGMFVYLRREAAEAG
jgi:predicted TPR repeat methyltransferase